MKKSVIVLLMVFLGLGLLMGLYAWSFYNRMVTANETVDNQWKQVENDYQRRFDLVPNLVNAVKGSMTQEEKIFSAIAEARTRYSGAGSVEEKISATNQMEGALGRLLVVMENYPDLKSSMLVQDLMVQLEGTENRISVERKRYNDTVKDYNLLVKRVPGKWLASIFGFTERQYFEMEEGAKKVPTVDLE